MKFGIFGDIHGNLSALLAVQSRLAQMGAERFLSVGDVVGYGAAPGECIEFLQEIDALVVQGNHDAACAGTLSTEDFNQAAREAIRWTRKELEPEHIAWLKQLPLRLGLEHCQIAHGCLANPGAFNYTMDLEAAQHSMPSLHTRVGFVGHSHVPMVAVAHREAPGRLAYWLDPLIDLSQLDRALINVGSIGQPRDEDPRAVGVLYDSQRATVEIFRVEYDVEREVARIKNAGLPQVLAERLRLGL
jgi:diadenosine tetraphosphatase ApaH/serine/threonine PP2A family protein phosphatase